MKMKWKRIFNNKVHNFEVDYLFSSKINGETLKMPRIYLEDQDMQDSIKSSVERVVLDNIKRKEDIVKLNENLDEKSRVRNHFRNVCFRKKFNTINEHVKYIAEYYLLPELTIYNYIEEDLPVIMQQSGLK